MYEEYNYVKMLDCDWKNIKNDDNAKNAYVDIFVRALYIKAI